MPVIILGGIYGGVFTPTEAAGVACAYGLFVGFFVYKELNFKKMLDVMKSSVGATSMVMMVIACATVFGTVMTREMIPQTATMAITSVAQTPAVFLSLVMVLLFVVGMFLDAAPAVMILTPILVPSLLVYGISPVAFGVIMIINLGIGLITPPVGMSLFVTASVSKCGVENVLSRHLLWYGLACAVVLFTLVFFPQVVTFLPNLVK
jgi:C4-dicarboxylate transporter DctM subunit